VLHYHIGSQITSVRRIKDAVKEAARIYAKLRQQGAPLDTLNVGGGLGIDYDGSGTPSDSSVNYTMQEFANNVVYTVQEVCEEEEVPSPALVSESGRALTAHHSLLITNCESRESDVPLDYSPDEVPGAPEEDAEELPPQLLEMEEIAREISVKNFREYYHDALQLRDELFTLFDLGYADLWNRGRGEELFRAICEKASAFSRKSKRVPEEFETLHEGLADTYVCNFSVFQSVPDSWALDHLFPIVPIQRLSEKPKVHATIADITCDSDGKIDRFVDLKDIKRVLPLHEPSSQPYYLAVLLIGAYQDIIGDFHNLLGAINEAQILIDERGDWHLAQLTEGDSVAEALSYVGYDSATLIETYRQQIQASVAKRKIKSRQALMLMKELEDGLKGYTYLKKPR
jgi:arginine decarboxylase